jgi:hypothetical protein|tara:strand:- start:895 stop:1638 length:744 start_codon:yes stop_codon:yes gene_type:complete
MEKPLLSSSKLEVDLSNMRTNLVELANANPPPFDSLEPIPDFDDVESDMILCETPTVDHGVSVPLAKIVGLDRPDVYNVSWNWLLRNQKKKLSYKELEGNPEYYLGADSPNGMKYTELNGEYYVAGDGKHRTVIAKYLAHFNPDHFPTEPVIPNATVYRYAVDYQLMERFRAAKRKLEKKGLNHISLRWVSTHQGKGKGRFHLYNPNREYHEGYTYSKADFHELESLISRSNLYNRWLGGERQCYLR